jgi:hypothetical protein
LKAANRNCLVWKLKELKVCTKKWIKDCKLKEISHLAQIDRDIKHLLQPDSGVMRTAQEEYKLKELELCRNKYLKRKEELWRQRSRAIWIKSGDSNTKFFHSFANFRRNKKIVWEIKDDFGNVHRGQETLKSEATNYFKSFFKAQDHSQIVDQVKVVSLYNNSSLRQKQKLYIAMWSLLN